MRAQSGTLAFLLATLGVSAAAYAHVPLFAPRVSLSLALDWHNLAVRALHAPRRPTAPASAHRHVVPRLGVTDGARPPAPTPTLDTQVVGRVEGWARSVLYPRYVSSSERGRLQFRSLYMTPYAPYLGCYGFNLNVETDALLR